MNKIFLLFVVVFLGCNASIPQSFKGLSKGVDVEAFVQNLKVFDTKTSYYPNGEMLSVLKDSINNAKERILLSLYGLDYCDLIDCLVNASKRKVKLFIILNNDPSNYTYEIFKNNKRVGVADTEKTIEGSSNGALVKWAIKPSGYNNRNYIYHKKLAIIDKTTIFLGSSNWTYAGFNTNGEINMMLKSSVLATQMDDEFIKTEWSDTKKVSDKRK